MDLKSGASQPYRSITVDAPFGSNDDRLQLAFYGWAAAQARGQHVAPCRVPLRRPPRPSRRRTSAPRRRKCNTRCISGSTTSPRTSARHLPARPGGQVRLRRLLAGRPRCRRDQPASRPWFAPPASPLPLAHRRDRRRAVTDGQLTLGFGPVARPGPTRLGAGTDRSIGRGAAGAAPARPRRSSAACARHSSRDAHPQAIVAITFTERAARDLVDKLRTRLPPALVPAIEQMNVGTIHAFCLRSCAAPARGRAAAGVLHPGRVARRRRAAERAVRLVIGSSTRWRTDDPQLDEAIDLLVATNGVYHFDALVGRSTSNGTASPRPRCRRCRLAHGRRRARALRRGRRRPPVPEKLRERMPSGAAMQRVAWRATDGRRARPGARHQRSHPGRRDGKPVRDESSSWCRRRARPSVTTCWRGVLARARALVLDEAPRRYQAGNVSFDDILVLTRRLLGSHPALLDGLRATSTICASTSSRTPTPLQYDIVRTLAAPAEPTRRPRCCSPSATPSSPSTASVTPTSRLFEHLRHRPPARRRCSCPPTSGRGPRCCGS